MAVALGIVGVTVPVATHTVHAATGQISVSDASITEGGLLVFNVSRTTVDGDCSVFVQTADGTATAPGDYGAGSVLINFIGSQISVGVLVSTVDDTIDEPAETVELRLSAATNGCTIADDTGVGTIEDNDEPLPVPSLSVADGSVTEGTGGTNPSVSFAVTSNPAASTNPCGARVTITNVTTADADFPSVTPIDIEIDTNPQNIQIPVTADAIDEPNETFTITVTGIALSGKPACEITDGTATGTIDDDDEPIPSGQFSVADATITEGGSLVFTLSRANGVGTCSVFVETADGTATAPGDYGAGNVTVTFSGSQTSVGVLVSTVDDTTDEPAETMELRLSNPTGNCSITDGTGDGTIEDDDDPPPVTWSVGDVSRPEGDGKKTTFTFTLSPSAPSAPTCGYTATFAHVTTTNGDFAAGALPAPISSTTGAATTISVDVAGDRRVEPDESFRVTLAGTGPVPCLFSDGEATGTVVNDDQAPPPTLSVSDVERKEGDQGTSDLTFTVRLSRPSSDPVTVRVTTSDDTAKAGSDYLAVDSIVTFLPGETTKRVAVGIIGDRTVERNERFTVRLSAPTGGATISRSTATGVILDDDGRRGHSHRC